MQHLVIFLKMFIQMIFSGSQSIKMMPAYSSVLSLYFQDLRWPKMISIYSAIFDWGPSSRLGVHGHFPLLISWWIFCRSIYCTVGRFWVSCEDCIFRASVYRFLRKCKFRVSDNRNMTPSSMFMIFMNRLRTMCGVCKVMRFCIDIFCYMRLGD